MSTKKIFKKLETPIPKFSPKQFWEEFFKESTYKLQQRNLESRRILEISCGECEIDNLKTLISFYDLPDGTDNCEVWSPGSSSSESTLIKTSPSVTDLQQHVPSFKSFGRKTKKQDPSNPYWKFFNRPPHKQTPWRPERQMALAPDMEIREKADKALKKILDKIRNFFVIFDERNAEFESEESFASLFDLVFDVPATSSVTQQHKILPAIPNLLAEELKILKASVNFRTLQECKWSLSLAKKPMRKMAFGTSLNVVDQFIPPTRELVKSWKTPIKNKDLHTMATVFRDIENLSVTKGFCNWLYTHPEIKDVAPYLKSIGVVRPKIITSKRTRRLLRLRTRYSVPASEFLTTERLSERKSEVPLKMSSESLISESIESDPADQIKQHVLTAQKVAKAGDVFKKLM